ncbi:MAG: hypothetical protein FWG85_07645, partial [Bacteroidetes bacterium]|nr:hypothetical protein [Bacteroidota bacterium]
RLFFMKSLFSKNCGIQSEVQATKNTTISGVLSSRLLNSTMTGKSSFNSTNNKEGGKCATISKRCRTTGMLLFLSTFLLLFFISTNGILQASCPAIEINDTCQTPWSYGPHTMTIEYPLYSNCFVTFTYCVRCDCSTPTSYELYIDNTFIFSPTLTCEPPLYYDLHMKCMEAALMYLFPNILVCGVNSTVVTRHFACGSWIFPTSIVCVPRGSGEMLNHDPYFTAQFAPCIDYYEFCSIYWSYEWDSTATPPILVAQKDSSFTPDIVCPAEKHFTELNGLFGVGDFLEYLRDSMKKEEIDSAAIEDYINSGSPELWEKYMEYIESQQFHELLEQYLHNNPQLRPCMPIDIEAIKEEFMYFIKYLASMRSFNNGFIKCESFCD